MPDRSSSERRKALKRDGRRCRKCGGVNEVAAHHVLRLDRGGPDTADNMLALCAICHAEWHMIETYAPRDFMQWLDMPPLGVLLTYLDRPDLWPEDMTARQFREELLKGFRAVRMMARD
jgi:hypothetical protein